MSCTWAKPILPLCPDPWVDLRVGWYGAGLNGKGGDPWGFESWGAMWSSGAEAGQSPMCPAAWAAGEVAVGLCSVGAWAQGEREGTGPSLTF